MSIITGCDGMNLQEVGGEDEEEEEGTEGGDG